MKARPTRVLSITSSPTQIRDTTQGPVTLSTYRYESGAGTIEVSSDPTFTAGNGQTIDAGVDFNDLDQGLTRYMLATGGTTSVKVSDYDA